MRRNNGFEVVEGCEVEFDARRGVLYVHSPTGATLLRVGQIPSTETMLDEGGLPTRMIDVTDRRGRIWARGVHGEALG